MTDKDEGIRYLCDAQRLALEPGDVLVLSVDAHLTNEMADRLKERVASIVGEDQKIMILTRGMTIGVLSKAAA